MDFLKYENKFRIDLELKYSNSLQTRNNYFSCIVNFLQYFKNEKEPKSISTDSIKLYLLEFKTIYTHVSTNIISKINSPLNNINI